MIFAELSLPVPEAVKVSELKLTGSPLGLVIFTCMTGTPSVPGIWVELGGGAGPWDTVKTGWVGVAVTVEVVVTVGVAVAVEVAVPLGVLVGVRVEVGVVVGVAVAVTVVVLVDVIVLSGLYTIRILAGARATLSSSGGRTGASGDGAYALICGMPASLAICSGVTFSL